MFGRRPPNPRGLPRVGDPDAVPSRTGMPRPNPRPSGGGSMPGFTTPTIPSLIGTPEMYRGRDGSMKITPTFPNRDTTAKWGGGKGTFGGSSMTIGGRPLGDLFGQGRPEVDGGLGRVGGVSNRGPWDDDPSDAWNDSITDIDIDSGMGRVGGGQSMSQYGIEGISNPSNRRSNDPGYWQDRMDELRGQSNFVDPTQDWGDDDWQDVYEPGDAVNIKAGGNENFGKAWDGDSWEDIDPNDPSAASMFAESRAWDTDYQQGIQEAWQNNDEQAFQRWRNLARAYETSKWQNQQPATPTPEPQYSVPRNPGKPTPKPAPTPPTPPYQAPDPWKKKQSPIY